MTNKAKHAFLVAAPASGSGKTTLTLGLMRALMQRDLRVQAFKCGPDFIDPMFHKAVTGRESYNLDIQMSDEQHVRTVFQNQKHPADVAVVEGVMGLFDGAVKDTGSSAHVARLLNLPVVLVVNASSMAYSAAPLLYGFKHFDPRVKVAGVLFNKVGSPGHYNFLKEAALAAGLPSLGYVPRNKGVEMPSRYLGLSMPFENNLEEQVGQLADLIQEHVDMDQLLNLTQSKETNPCISSTQQKQAFRLNGLTPPRHHGPNKHFLLPAESKQQLPLRPSVSHCNRPELPRLKIAMARDEAFNFIYPANVDALKHYGTLQYFSPLHDKALPEADLIWFPGGYPELYVSRLSRNRDMAEAIQRHVAQGKALIAECGGFIYLGRELLVEGKPYPMAGVFDHGATLKNARLSLGYRQISYRGTVWYGHEFHYSQLAWSTHENIAEIRNARNQMVDTGLYRYKNALASYLHFYCGQREKMEALLRLVLTKNERP
jgi:cobyrinic acid a,c-diamide synthase